MHTWLWGQKSPGMMDTLVPMASQPNALSGRNWILRRMLIESIKRDPAWKNGDYQTKPPALPTANIMCSVSPQRAAPSLTRVKNQRVSWRIR
ncbi:MAG: hypothetical protein ACR5LF_12270 [Symbiopectobacterium sp.]